MNRIREKKNHTHHHRRTSSGGTSPNEEDPSDGNGSLTYSAASSINSAGESTDSSFANIMRVLDGHEGGFKELAAYLKREAARTTDKKSIAGESLAYSTDAESQMMKSLATDVSLSLCFCLAIAVLCSCCLAVYCGSCSKKRYRTVPFLRIDSLGRYNNNDDQIFI